jgi:negative regulator of flagellin synthesis FlgM
MRVTDSGNSNQVSNADVSRVKVTRAKNENEKSGETSHTARTGGSGAVNAEISDKGKEFAKAKAAASAAPDVREEKIAALKARIADGKYKVDADAVADRMVDEHLKMSGMS